MKGATLVLVAALAATPSASASPEEDHIETGKRAYRLGAWDEAIESWTRAYELTGNPLILYNLAQAHRMKGDHERAIFFFKSYLRELPEAENRAQVEKLLAESERHRSEATRETTGTVVLPPAPAPRSRFVVDADLLVAFPKGDYDPDFVATSPGIRVALGYAPLPWLRARAGFRYVHEINSGDYAASYYDVGVGAELVHDPIPSVSVQVAADIVYATERIESDAVMIHTSASGLGFAARFGATYAFTPMFAAGAGFSYLTAQLDGFGGDTTATWLALDLRAAVRF